MPAHNNNNDDAFQTIDMNTMDEVKGGAGSSDMSSMMPMMMMMMMMRGNNQPPPQAIAPVAPQFTVNGAPQQVQMGADGSWNYTSNGEF